MTVTVRAVRPPEPHDLEHAWRAVRELLAPTSVVPSSLAPGALLKLETSQPTGSFKVRGALAALAALPEGMAAVTASAGNHGLAIAYAASRAGAEVTVVVAETASPAKVAKIESYPVTLVRHGTLFDHAERYALTLPGHYISAYNDPRVIAGQATIGRELDEQVTGPLTVVAPLGGGGLLSGLCLWARERGDVRIVGVESSVSRAVSASVAAGRIVRLEIGDSIADGITGNVEAGCVTPGLLGAGPVEFTSVTDSEIRAALRWLFTAHGLVAEGAGACGVAAVLAGKVEISGRLVVVLSGRNMTPATYAESLTRD